MSLNNKETCIVAASCYLRREGGTVLTTLASDYIAIWRFHFSFKRFLFELKKNYYFSKNKIQNSLRIHEYNFWEGTAGTVLLPVPPAAIYYRYVQYGTGGTVPKVC